METVNHTFMRGFNDGYIVRQYEPQLAEKLSTINGTSERVEGLKAGIEECTKEMGKDYLPAWMTKDKDSPSSPDKAKDDVDKDDRDI